jgi:hypothetical protein
MGWQPPTPEQVREHALRMRAQMEGATLTAVARLRVVGVVVGVVGVLLAVGLAPVLGVVVPGNDKLVAVLVVAGVGAMLVAFGLYSYAIYRPLPKELLASGAATPAVVLEAGMVGPTIETSGFGVSGTLMRHRYRLEVQPAGGAPYVVEVRTFDGPMIRALNRPPLTVYVDPRDKSRVCPDWSTLPRGA